MAIRTSLASIVLYVVYCMLNYLTITKYSLRYHSCAFVVSVGRPACALTTNLFALLSHFLYGHTVVILCTSQTYCIAVNSSRNTTIRIGFAIDVTSFHLDYSFYHLEQLAWYINLLSGSSFNKKIDVILCHFGKTLSHRSDHGHIANIRSVCDLLNKIRYRFAKNP